MSTAANISEAQLNANRENANQSTCPRTEEGKKRVRLNGLRHGLTGQTIVMPYEDAAEYEQFVAHTIAALDPESDAERALAINIANDTWRFGRARAIEENIFTLGTQASLASAAGDDEKIDRSMSQAQTFLNNAKEIQLLSLYAGRIARAIDKNKKELFALQDARRKAADKALEEEILLAQLAESKGETYITQENGFGFSTPEVLRALDRRRRLEEARARFKPARKAA